MPEDFSKPRFQIFGIVNLSIIFGMALTTAILAIIYLHVATYNYTAEIGVIPAQSDTGSQGNSRLAGLASLAGVGLGTQSANPILLYQESIRSLAVAQTLGTDEKLMRRVFSGEWDAKEGRWTPRAGFVGRVLQNVTQSLGAPKIPWRAPDARNLRDYLAKNITIEASPKTPVVWIRFNDSDPTFASELLDRADRAADEQQRRAALSRTSASIAYLSGQLSRTSIAEHRAAIANLLSEQEKSRMLAASDLPYAAERFIPLSVSRAPTSPRPLVVLAGAIVCGLLFGVLAVLGRYLMTPASAVGD